jgi:hypothetical protein
LIPPKTDEVASVASNQDNEENHKNSTADDSLARSQSSYDEHQYGLEKATLTSIRDHEALERHTNFIQCCACSLQVELPTREGQSVKFGG